HRALTAAGVDADFGRGARAQFAYDASHFRVAPVGVAYPRSVADVVATLAACADAEVPVIPRGGGTSMAGNAIGPGLVLDFSRHMTAIGAVDTAGRTVTAQPGVVLDDLQRALRPHGLEFGPDPSSHSRATLGGMIGNDACGNHSVRHGRTVTHVVELELVLADGSHLRAGPGGLSAADPADGSAAARAAQLNATLHRLTTQNLAIVRRELGRIGRQVSGYQLHHLLPEHGFDVARMLTGTEGSCAVIVGVTLKLVPTPPSALLIAVGYPDVVAAADDVPAILEFGPAAVEGLDESIVATMRARRGPDSVTGLPDGDAWLYVDLDGDDPADVARRADELVTVLRARGHLTDARVVPGPADRASLWRVREDGAGLSARRPDGRQTWSGWEDSAVDPADLPGYLREFRSLLTEYGLTGVMYGHFGAGCIHVRIDFDLHTAAGIHTMGRFVRAAARLVTRYGGTLSGEHGDGRSRSELLTIMYSAEMLALFGAVKDAFDPRGLLNPGIIVRPDPVTAHIAPHTVTLGTPQFAYPDDPGGFADGVGRCVGIARCRSDIGGVMCPSYRVTHDENHSTRGRARALQEMLRGEVITDGWRSPEVANALDLCLSCKACSSDCPVGVDMATYKSEFLHHHYRGRWRPRTHYSLGWLPVLARLAGVAPALVNRIAGHPGAHRALAAAGGVTAARPVPRFAAASAARRAARPYLADPGRHDAVLFTDTFTRAFRPTLMRSAAAVLTAAGLDLTTTDGVCCGLTWITTGQLGTAKRVLRRTVAALERTGPGPIVVLEPSCAAALHKDLRELVPTAAARRVAARVVTFAGAVEDRIAAGWQPPPLPEEVMLQQHCHEYAVFGATTQQRVLSLLGVRSVRNATGCCGLAGNFGFERDHYDISVQVAGLALRPALDSAAARQAIVADGFSCQTQITHLNPDGNPAPAHLAELIHAALPAAAQNSTTEQR
ncbi:FAD-binding and (Fe-S)-binding domain-containing protein, partial [Mycolicibacterium sp.]